MLYIISKHNDFTVTRRKPKLTKYSLGHILKVWDDESLEGCCAFKGGAKKLVDTLNNFDEMVALGINVCDYRTNLAITFLLIAIEKYETKL